MSALAASVYPAMNLRLDWAHAMLSHTWLARYAWNGPMRRTTSGWTLRWYIFARISRAFDVMIDCASCDGFSAVSTSPKPMIPREQRSDHVLCSPGAPGSHAAMLTYAATTARVTSSRGAHVCTNSRQPSACSGGMAASTSSNHVSGIFRAVPIAGGIIVDAGGRLLAPGRGLPPRDLG